MAINFAGYLFNDAGSAVADATVKLLQVSDDVEEASTTTNSDGYWAFSESDQDRYDVEITSGTSVRRIKWADEISVKEIDVRNSEGEGTPAATFSNIANGDDMEIVHFRGLRGTGVADDNMFFRYYMNDDGGNITEVARMTVNLVDAGAATEDAKIVWSIRSAGSDTLVDALTIASSGSAAQSIDFNQDSITFGTGTAATDITLTFDAESADGVITWMEDEDYFQFSDDILMSSTEKIQFLDDAIYIYSSTDGQLDLVADTEIQIAATTIDINGAADISGDLTLSGGADGALQFTNAGENSIKIPDNQASALIIEEANNAYITFVTTNSSEAITVAKATTFSAGIADSGTISAGTWNGTAIASGYIAADAITGAKIADDAIDSEHYTDGSIDNAHIADDAIDSEHYAAASIDFAHIQNVAANSILGRNANSSGVLSEVALATTQLLIGDGTGFTAAALSGDATMTNAGVVSLAAAQTNVTSMYNTGLILGGDAQTAIDFGTSNEIDFKADNAVRLTLTSGALYPVTDNQIDLGTSSLEFKDAFFDGTVTADAFAGPLTGNVTGNASGTALTVTQAAQSAITSLGTLTTLTVDNVITNGTTIGHTSDTDLMTLADGVLTVAGELDAATLDISGNADIDGTTNLDAVDIDGAVQLDGTLTVGVDDTGYDVKLFGANSGSYLLWDQSTNDLVSAGATHWGINELNPGGRLHITDASAIPHLIIEGGADDDDLYPNIILTEHFTTTSNFFGFNMRYIGAANTFQIVSQNATNPYPRLAIDRNTGNTLLEKGDATTGSGQVVSNRTQDAALTIYNSADAYTFMNISHSGSGYGGQSTSGFDIGINASEQASLVNRENADMFFMTNDTERIRILAAGNVGIGTSAAGAILDVNSGSGNMIADGYDTHSLAEYKENITDSPSYLDKVSFLTPKTWTRKPHVGANEIRDAAIEHFGQDLWDSYFPEEDSHRDKALKNMPDCEMKSWIDEWAESKREERRNLPEWQEVQVGLVADARDTSEYMPEVISTDSYGNPQGISMANYVGILHSAIRELKQEVDRIKEAV